MGQDSGPDVAEPAVSPSRRVVSANSDSQGVGVIHYPAAEVVTVRVVPAKKAKKAN